MMAKINAGLEELLLSTVKQCEELLNPTIYQE